MLISSTEATRRYRRERKDLLVRVMGGKCAICGYNKTSLAMEFHHLDKTQKEFALSNSNRTLESQFVELKKCVLLCSNCHREVHGGLHNDVELSCSFDDEIANDELKKYDIKHPNREKIKPILKCKECGRVFAYKSVSLLCRKCSSVKQRKYDRPDKESLKYMIRNMQLEEVAKKYGTSSNVIRKWCDFCGLPRRKREINKISDEEWEKI